MTGQGPGDACKSSKAEAEESSVTERFLVQTLKSKTTITFCKRPVACHQERVRENMARTKGGLCPNPEQTIKEKDRGGKNRARSRNRLIKRRVKFLKGTAEGGETSRYS